MNSRTAMFIEKEAERLKCNLATYEAGYEVRCVTAVAKRILLDGLYSYNGHWCRPTAKSIGAGVYVVTVTKDGNT